MHPSRARSISRRATEVVRYPCPFIPSSRTRERRRRGPGEGGERGEGGAGRKTRENYRLGCTALKSASSPLTGGLNFSPTRRAPGTGCARLRPPYYPALPLPRVTHTRVPAVPPTSTPSPVSRGQHFCGRGGELPVATARRDGDAPVPRPRWN